MQEKKTNPLLVIAVISIALFAGNEAQKYSDQGGGDFADSAALQKLTAVDNSLIYSDGKMKHVHGLSNLGLVNGRLDLSGNDLPNIQGLRSLSTVKGGLDLSDNLFYTIEPLKNLTLVGGSLDLRENRNLFNIAALAALSDLGGFLYLDSDIHLRQDFLGIPNDSYLCTDTATSKIRGPSQAAICQ